MATSVNNQENVTLANGIEVGLRPLVVARLRRAYEAWGEFEKAATDNREVDELDVLINVAGICIEHDLKTEIEGVLFTDKSKLKLSKEYKEYLENCLDRETIEQILLVAASIDLKAMREAMQRVALDGMTST